VAPGIHAMASRPVVISLGQKLLVIRASHSNKLSIDSSQFRSASLFSPPIMIALGKALKGFNCVIALGKALKGFNCVLPSARRKKADSIVSSIVQKKEKTHYQKHLPYRYSNPSALPRWLKPFC
jgi:hypothetical protein